MHERVFILFAAWIAVGVAFYFGHPIAYTVIVIGLAATVAIAAENLLEVNPEPNLGRVAWAPARERPGSGWPKIRVPPIPVAATHLSHPQSAPTAETLS